jgi:UDP-N-acetylmuramoyl-L-alanyl-D-glutamate--2,6-diaminopimelate ligase
VDQRSPGLRFTVVVLTVLDNARIILGMTLPLSELIKVLPDHVLNGDATTPVTGLALNAQSVQPGELFMPIVGVERDGHAFIPLAVQRGAAAVLGEHNRAELVAQRWLPETIPYVQVPDGRTAHALVSAAFYGYPSRQLKVIGVTGTDGKTTTCNLIYSVLTAAGYRVGMISTIGARIGDAELDTGFHTTTPTAPEIQHYLAHMVARGTDYAVIEATSHGLAMHRVDAVDFDVAVVTNITHEHLDYHGSLEAYQHAKAGLFRKLSRSYRKPGTPKVAVLNVDDSSFEYLSFIPADWRITYSAADEADVMAKDSGGYGGPPLHSGLAFQVVTPEGQFPVISPLIGTYNVSNILAAVCVAFSQGIQPAATQAGVAAVNNIRGRMDPVDAGQDFLALVDFAHTPNALQRALETARGLTAGQVIVVFGCAGLRDREKRPWMGEIAGRLADRIVITAEDPRTESLAAIMDQIARGCQRAGRREGESFWRIGDRTEAIQFAANLARPGDVVIVCGKGHEQSMCYGTTELLWSDHAALQAALEQVAARE